MAYDPETGTVSEGEALEDALKSLREAVGSYLEEFHISIAGAAFVTTFSSQEHA